MKKSIKKGFGLAIGAYLAAGLFGAVSGVIEVVNERLNKNNGNSKPTENEDA